MAEVLSDTGVVSPSIVTDSVNKIDVSGDAGNKKGPNYILIGALVIVLLILIYYGYTKFTENKEEDFTDKKIKKKTKNKPIPREDNLQDASDEETISPLKKKLNKVSDDTVIDYNLRESIDELRHLQQKVMGTLSDTADI
jgi:hypothetical protein